MKFSINQNEFNNTLTVVSKGAATRSTLPILSGILIKAFDNMLILEATDMDQSIRCSCPALIEEEGETVVPARLLTDIVKNLPDAAIHFSYSEDAATVLCDTSSFSLKTLQASDFPGFPEAEEQNCINLPFKTFSSMVKKVSRAVSRDDSNPILSGVLLQVENNVLRMVATDSRRLSLCEAELETPSEEFSAVISGTFLNDLASLLGEYEQITLALSENQIIAKYGSYTFINRRIEGNYPPYNQLLTGEFTTHITFNTQQLLQAIKRVSLVSSNTSPVRFDLNQASQTTQLSSTTKDVGAAQETISSQIEGEDIQIAFNSRYLIDGLSTIDDEIITLDLLSNLKQGIFRNQDGSFIYLLMPVRFS